MSCISPMNDAHNSHILYCIYIISINMSGLHVLYIYRYNLPGAAIIGIPYPRALGGSGSVVGVYLETMNRSRDFYPAKNLTATSYYLSHLVSWTFIHCTNLLPSSNFEGSKIKVKWNKILWVPNLGEICGWSINNKYLTYSNHINYNKQ